MDEIKFLKREFDLILTATKLIDAWTNKGPTNLRLSEKESPKSNHLDRDMCESVIAYFLLQGYLKEDFHFTPYSTISYLVPGNYISSLLVQMIFWETKSNNSSIKYMTSWPGKQVASDQLSMQIAVKTTTSDTKPTRKKKPPTDSSSKKSTKKSRVECVTIASDSDSSE